MSLIYDILIGYMNFDIILVLLQPKNPYKWPPFIMKLKFSYLFVSPFFFKYKLFLLCKQVFLNRTLLELLILKNICCTEINLIIYNRHTNFSY